jgi:hypothetical protein
VSRSTSSRRISAGDFSNHGHERLLFGRKSVSGTEAQACFCWIPKKNHANTPFLVVALPGWVGDHERAASFQSRNSHPGAVLETGDRVSARGPGEDKRVAYTTVQTLVYRLEEGALRKSAMPSSFSRPSTKPNIAADSYAIYSICSAARRDCSSLICLKSSRCET